MVLQFFVWLGQAAVNLMLLGLVAFALFAVFAPLAVFGTQKSKDVLWNSVKKYMSVWFLTATIGFPLFGVSIADGAVKAGETSSLAYVALPMLMFGIFLLCTVGVFPYILPLKEFLGPRVYDQMRKVGWYVTGIGLVLCLLASVMK